MAKYFAIQNPLVESHEGFFVDSGPNLTALKQQGQFGELF